MSLGTAFLVCSEWEHILVSPDTGRTFSETPQFQYAQLMDFKTAPAGAGRAWRVTYLAGILLTEDYGQTWNPVSTRFMHPDTLARHLDVLGQGDTLIAAVGSAGVYLSTDGGVNFAHLSINFPEGQISDIVKTVTRSPLEIWSFLRHDGIWSYTPWDSLGAVERKRTYYSASSRIVVYPNPTAGSLSITGISRADHFELEVVNILGQSVAGGIKPNSSSHLDIALSRHLPSGTYFVRLVSRHSPLGSRPPIVLKIFKN